MKKSVLFLLALSLFVGFSPAFAATNYFVDKDGNPEPYAVLCNTHVLNVGMSQTNPVLDAQKQEMNRVIAAKSELITREMKKQYDYLDATVKRFQIQLQKAILVAKAEAAGAASPMTSATGGISEYDDCRFMEQAPMQICIRGNFAKYQTNLRAKKLSQDMVNSLGRDAAAAGATCSGVRAIESSITDCMSKINTKLNEISQNKQSVGGYQIVPVMGR